MYKMTSKRTEINTFFGVCSCCSKYGYLKSMWATYKWHGKSEVYGKMLVQCFALKLSPPESESKAEICAECIIKLREAYHFKKLLIESKNSINANSEGGDMDSSCPELNTFEQIFEENEDIVASANDSSNHKIENYKKSPHAKHMKVKSEPQEETYENVEFLDEYEDVEYLEEDACNEEVFHKTEDLQEDKTILFEIKMEEQDKDYQDEEGLDETTEPEDITDITIPPPPRKRKTRQKNRPITDVSRSGETLKYPKKLPPEKRWQTYRQYGDSQIVAAVALARSGRASIRAAAERYGVSRTMVTKHLRIVEKDPEALKNVTNSEQFKLMGEIKQVLRLTNMTPFTSRSHYAACLYCHETPRDVVKHTWEEHAEHRISKVELAMRPTRTNEILRVNTRHLQCTQCDMPIAHWNTMLSHLQTTHELQLDLVYTHLIPYHLPYNCALCHQTFSSFLILDTHMNSHYANHVCPTCGDNFITIERLRIHSQSHNIGRFPCTHCDKIFSHESILKRHLDNTHKLGTRFKCKYCDEKFSSEYVRHRHLLDEHKEKVELINCEYCDKSFTWRQNLREHVRKVHIKLKKYECTECDKKFMQMCELKEHMLRHTGKRDYACSLCDKKYFNRLSLRMHMLYHRKVESKSRDEDS